MLRQATILLLNLNLLISLSIDDPYCTLRYRRLCQGKGSHVACQFPVAGPGPLCRNYSRIKFTSDLKTFIIHYINRRRQRIASGHEHVRGGAPVPKPQIMITGIVNWLTLPNVWPISVNLHTTTAELQWKSNLMPTLVALRLQPHAVLRYYDHLQVFLIKPKANCSLDIVRYPYAGQSVGEVRWRAPTGSADATYQRAIRRVLDAWWGEKRRVKPEQLTATFKPAAKGTVWGHFSQLAVWTLQAVGCGAVSHGHRNIRLLLVCDFSHTNMLGQKTINPGPLAPCPMRTVRKSRTAHPLLCAPVRRPIISIYGKPDDDYETNNREIEHDDSYDEERKQTTGLITNKIINLHQYMESTEIFYNDDDTEEFRVTLLPDIDHQKHQGLFQTRHSKLEISTKNDRLLSEKKPYYAKFRDALETVTEVAPKKLSAYEDGDKLQYFRKSTRQESILRHRWKENKKRPRPGVQAPLKPPEKLQRQSSGFLMLDQDDLDQFFRDTGFHVNWRKKPVE